MTTPKPNFYAPDKEKPWFKCPTGIFPDGFTQYLDSQTAKKLCEDLKGWLPDGENFLLTIKDYAGATWGYFAAAKPEDLP